MLVFPSNPNAGDVFAPGPGFPSWQWDGEKWTRSGGGLQLALEALTDVAVSQPAQGDMLAWDAGTEQWVNTAPPEGVTTLAALLDVTLATPAAGQPLTYNGYSWQNGGPLALAGDPTTALQAATKQYVDNKVAALPTTLAALADTSLANLAAGQALTWTGSAWVNANVFSSMVVNQSNSGVPLIVNGNGYNIALQSPAGVSTNISWAQAGRTQWQLLNDGGSDLLRFWNANSGTVMQMSNAGNVAVGGNVDSSGGFSVNGVPLALSGNVIVSWAAAEARVNTTTPSVSAYATYAIPTAGTYVIEFMAPIWQNVDGTAGFNFTPYFSGTITSGTGVWISTGPNVSGQVAFNNNAGGTTFSIPWSNTWQWSIYFKGYLVAGSAGQFAVAFAQNSLTSQITSYMGHASRAGFLSVTRIR